MDTKGVSLRSITDTARLLGIEEAIVSKVAKGGLVTVTKVGGDPHVDPAEVAFELGIDPELGESPSLGLVELKLAIKKLERIRIAIDRERLVLREAQGLVMPIVQVRRERISRIRVVRAALMALPREAAGQSEGFIRERIERILGMFAGKGEAEDVPGEESLDS